jgi:tetratricopeptide (TPR) repeat protein
MENLDTIQELVDLFGVATQRAAEALRDAKALSDDSGEYHLKLGLAAYFIREYEIAQREFEKSFERKKTSDAAVRTGLSWFRLGNLAEAERWFKTATELEPGGKLEALVLGTTTPYHSILASVQLSRGDASNAEKNAQQAIALIPSDYLAGQVLTRVATLRGDTAGAQAFAAELDTQASTTGGVALGLGLLKKDDHFSALSLPIEFLALRAV